MKSVWEAMNEMEKIAADDLQAANYLTDIGVTDLHWCKALLIHLFEHSFEDFHDKAKEAIKKFRDQIWTTLVPTVFPSETGLIRT